MVGGDSRSTTTVYFQDANAVLGNLQIWGSNDNTAGGTLNDSVIVQRSTAKLRAVAAYSPIYTTEENTLHCQTCLIDLMGKAESASAYTAIGLALHETSATIQNAWVRDYAATGVYSESSKWSADGLLLETDYCCSAVSLSAGIYADVRSGPSPLNNTRVILQRGTGGVNYGILQSYGGSIMYTTNGLHLKCRGTSDSAQQQALSITTGAHAEFAGSTNHRIEQCDFGVTQDDNGLVLYSFAVTFASNTVNTVGPHLQPYGDTPALSACGSSPQWNQGPASDLVGKFTVGGGASVTSCTLTFTKPFINSPVCDVRNESSIQLLHSYTSTTTLTIDASATFDADVVNFTCQGRR
jgi:hypothetical protein